jgi:hypothetical protein
MAAVTPIHLAGRQRAPVLIVGAHRSGTTATARALEMLGLQIGQRLDSHRESKELQRLHESYLRECSASWYDPARFLEKMRTTEGVDDCAEYLRGNLKKRFGRIFAYRGNVEGFWLRLRLWLGAAWGWKEPRTTLFAPAWLRLYPEATVVHVVRDPRLVAESICRRELAFRATGDAPQAGLDDIDYCMGLACAYVEAGESIRHLTDRYRQVHFEDLQTDPAGRLPGLADFCGLSISDEQLTRSAATIKPPRPTR